MDYSEELKRIFLHLIDLNVEGNLEFMALVVKEKDSSGTDVILANISEIDVANLMDVSLLKESALTVTKL